MSKLKEYCINITDGEHGSVKEDLSGEYYFLNNNNITSNGIIIKPDDRRISITEFDRIHKRTKLAAGDIVIATCGTIGKCQVIRDEKINFDFSRSVGIIKCDSSRLLPDFLYYYLINPHTQSRIKKISEGGVQKHFYIGAMQEFDIEVQPIDIQRKIIAVLSAIDKKIQYNNKINDNLQHQLKLLYDYWFTQFDFPDENGKPYRASGGAFVWNEQLKRKIPVNWKAEMLSDVFEVTMGSSPTGDSLNDNNNGIEFYQGSTDFGSLYPTERIYTTAPIRYAKQQDVLLSVRAPVGALNIAMNNCCIGRGLAAIHHESTAYAWCTLKALQPFFDIFNANGTTFGALTSDDLKNHYIISPDNDELQAFIRISKPIEEKMRVISKEIRQLSTLRDWLLPMLMNGQATISN